MDNKVFLPAEWEARRLNPTEFRTNFQKEWNSLKKNFFKYEACQHYTQSGDASFEALMEGKLYKAARLISEELTNRRDLYDTAGERGLQLIRVRAVDYPLSYYLHYEFISYLTSQQLGEQIRIVKLDEIGEINMGDFLLFDDRVALVHNYVLPTNEQDGGWLVDGAAGLAYLKHCRKTLTERSVTLDDFVVPGEFLHSPAT